jgi:uncharacterized Zn finger protein
MTQPLCVNCGSGELSQVTDTGLQALLGAILECRECGTIFHDTGDTDPHNKPPVGGKER